MDWLTTAGIIACIIGLAAVLSLFIPGRPETVSEADRGDGPVTPAPVEGLSPAAASQPGRDGDVADDEPPGDP